MRSASPAGVYSSPSTRQSLPAIFDRLSSPASCSSVVLSCVKNTRFAASSLATAVRHFLAGAPLASTRPKAVPERSIRLDAEDRHTGTVARSLVKPITTTNSLPRTRCYHTGVQAVRRRRLRRCSLRRFSGVATSPTARKFGSGIQMTIVERWLLVSVVARSREWRDFRKKHHDPAH